MTQYIFKRAVAGEITALRQDYLRQLTAPLDGMWESFVHMADDYIIRLEDKIIGYCTINTEQQFLQFFVPAVRDPGSVFEQALTELSVRGAVVATCEPHFLSLCLDRQKSIAMNALMYRLEKKTRIEEAIFPSGAIFRVVEADELEAAVKFGVENLGADPGWLTGYFTERIDGQELFGLWQDGLLIATGECRPSKTHKPIADLGMMVANDQRGKGIATHILRQLLHLCRERKVRAICSTESRNIAAQKAIARAGFTSYHRILDITF